MDDGRLDYWFHRSSSYFLSAWKCFETVSDASRVKENTRDQIEAMFLSHQGHLFWVLTGLGSMPNHFLSVKKISKCQLIYLKVVFMSLKQRSANYGPWARFSLLL